MVVPPRRHCFSKAALKAALIKSLKLSAFFLIVPPSDTFYVIREVNRRKARRTRKTPAYMEISGTGGTVLPVFDLKRI